MAATSNLTRLRYISEATFGTTPGTGTSEDLRFTGESLNYTLSTETSQEIRSDRQIADLVQVGAEASGDVQFELSYGTFDSFMAAALGGSWSTDDLTNGITVPFFSIEKGFTDINQYILFRGMAVNTMSLDFAAESILTGSFGFLGKDSIIAGTSGVPAVAAGGTLTEVMNATSNFADMSIGGSTYPCGINSISLNTDGGLRAQNAIGNLGACSIAAGTFSPTGSISVYFSDATIYSNYIANSPFALTWKVRDAAGNSYVFSMPRVKITNATVVAGGLDTDVMLDLDYQALYDATATHTIKITRDAA